LMLAESLGRAMAFCEKLSRIRPSETLPETLKGNL